MEQILSLFKENPSRKTKNAFDAFYYIFALCISEFYFGYTLIYLSAVDFNLIVRLYNIDYDASVAQGIFQGIMPIGGAIGAISSAFFISLFSRRNLIFFLNFMGAILCILTLVSNYKIFLLTRLLQGATCGLISAVIPMIVKEASPHQISSITGLFANAFIITGLFFLYLIAYILGMVTNDFSGTQTWKFIFLFPLVGIVLQTVLLFKVYPFETPKYLAHNNKTQQLKELMSQFYKIEYVEEMYDHYMKHHGPSLTPDMEEFGSTSNQEKKNIHKGSKCALLYGIFYAFLTPMSGINVIMSYGGQVISKIAPELSAIMPSILMFFYLVSSIFSVILLKKYGRKLLTIAGTVGISSTLYVISYAYFISTSNISLSQFLIVLCLFVYLLIYGLTYAPVMWMWLSEALLPNTIGYAVMINWSGASLVMVFFPILLNHIPDNNPAIIFLFFGVFLTLSLYVTSKFMLETKDKFEHEIAQEYSKLDEEYFGKGEANPQSLQMGLITKK